MVFFNVVLESRLNVLRVVNVLLKTSRTKNNKTCTEVTKVKKRLFQTWLKFEVKILSCKLSTAQHYMKSLDMAFLQRLLKFTFIKVLSSSEKK